LGRPRRSPPRRARTASAVRSSIRASS
jgi:hypothetical protein